MFQPDIYTRSHAAMKLAHAHEFPLIPALHIGLPFCWTQRQHHPQKRLRSRQDARPVLHNIIVLEDTGQRAGNRQSTGKGLAAFRKALVCARAKVLGDCGLE